MSGRPDRNQNEQVKSDPKRPPPPPSASSRIKRKSKKKDDENQQKLLEEQEKENEAEFQRALLEVRVKELETLNFGLIRKSEYLETQNNIYKTQLDELREEKEDLVAHLKKSWTEEKTLSTELQDRLIGMQLARTEDQAEFEAKLKGKDAELLRTKEELESKITELNLKLLSVDDFLVQKKNFLDKIQSLEQRLRNEQEKFQLKYNQLETKSLLDIDRIKKNSKEVLLSIARDLQEGAKLSLSITAKSAIAANVKLNDELEKVSQNNLDLRDKVVSLKSRVRDLQLNIEVLEEQNALIHQKTIQYKLIVGKLLEEQVELDKKITAVDEVETELKNLKETHSGCMSRIKELSKARVKSEADLQRSIAQELYSSLVSELKFLRDIILKMAVTSKDMTEAQNSEELEFLKERFKEMVVKIYETACDMPDVSPELRNRLKVKVPQLTPCIKHCPK